MADVDAGWLCEQIKGTVNELQEQERLLIAQLETLRKNHPQHPRPFTGNVEASIERLVRETNRLL